MQLTSQLFLWCETFLHQQLVLLSSKLSKVRTKESIQFQDTDLSTRFHFGTFFGELFPCLETMTPPAAAPPPPRRINIFTGCFRHLYKLHYHLTLTHVMHFLLQMSLQERHNIPECGKELI